MDRAFYARVSASINATQIEESPRNYGVLAEQGIEEELFTLQSVAPEVISSLPSVFKEAVLSSINNMLDRRNAGILLMLLEGVDMSDLHELFTALDDLDFRRSGVLKRAISMEFHSRVHTLVKKVTGAQTPSEDLAGRMESLSERIGVKRPRYQW